MKIGEIQFQNNVFLAPMAGVTDIAFRELCEEQGCGLAYTEMVSSKALFYGSENTEKLTAIGQNEDKIAVQIFGNDPIVMAKSCDYFNENNKICLIDINMGCPAPKIVKNGEGSALMKSPKLAYEIVRSVKKASKKPVTVKFRKGFDELHINAVEFSKIIEEAGADAITIHGRTREQMYSGKADWNIIKEIKESVKIPVIGNGDIFSAEAAAEMFNHTNCDGIMIARGAMGNPWIFKQIKDKINGHNVYDPAPREKIDMCIRHYKKSIEYFGEDKAVREMRKQIAWYIKGLENCTEIKNVINYEKNSKEVIKTLLEYKNTLEAI
ncbi:tRNA dihydrouridine synthase DusB [Clostridium sp. JN-9]|uniref:tRNA dihydrouridine synthase DusB n=1 Tax=Clostridium sp. JN-9 TaxID=2507159 RepID=UPI000FFE122C|nr:tRNA dihydrouridine synthase DusB [Clostridium sp. JN-9]QAT41441.1 tRNA dihydrouridine synthase DusB [Clostridium sp. JN-9]